MEIHGVSQAAKIGGVTANINKRRSPAPTACGANLLDNCYSKTLMDTQNMKTVDIKEVILFSIIMVEVKINDGRTLTAFSCLQLIMGSISIFVTPNPNDNFSYIIT